MTESDLFIDGNAALAELLAAIPAAQNLALDTEFVRERTYYPKLCLIQVDTSEFTACIDFLADLDLESLFSCLFSPERTWVLHSARQDLEVIYQHANRMPATLIDTQIAAGLLGYPPQIGLQDLLAEKLRVKLEKGYARTDWARRPLPEPALRYALDDVRSLIPLWQHLEAELAELGRIAWLEEDCQTVLDTPPITPAVTLWTRLKGLGSMAPQNQCAALALVNWRERYARTLDRPRRWIMSDALLLRIANALPTKLSQLKRIPEMPSRLAERAGQDLLSELERYDRPKALELIRTQLASDRPKAYELRKSQARVREHAATLGIHSEILATRKELGEALVGRPSRRLEEGWRSVELRHLLSGNP